MTKPTQKSIGETPNEWTVRRVKEIFSLEYGKGLPERQRIFGKYPVAGSNGIIGNHNESLVSGPGIVVGRKGTIGAISWIESDFWPIDTTYYVKLKRDNVFLPWLFYKLSHLNLERFNMSDVVPGLKRDLVYSIKFAIPPLPEQKRIAEVLSTVDNSIQKADKSIEKTERLKKGLMQKLLTEGIGHKEFKQTKIGKIPKAWKITKLKDITTKIKDIDHKMPEKIENGIPFVSIKYMLKFQDHDFKIDFDDPDLEFISKEDYEHHRKRFDAEEKDLIYSRFGSIGNAKLINTKQPLIASYSVVLIKPDKEKVDPLFLVYALNSSKVRIQAKISTKGATNRNLHLADINNLIIPFPQLKEQKKIAGILSTIDKKLDFDIKRKEKFGNIKKGLMNDLLTGKRRVRVGV